jgi:HEAT repeat protein
VNADLNSSNFELRMAALNFMLHVDEKSALPHLINKLKDDHWEIRLVAIHRLAKIKAESAMHDIAKCLSDSDERVKMGAAVALKSFGAQGTALLKEHAPDLADNDFNTTEHLPGTLW